MKEAEHSVAGRQVPYCMFTDPQLGRIGMTEKEALEKGYAIEIARLPMDKTSRGIETGNTRGMMKAVIDKASGQILGAALLGEEGGEVMSVLQMGMLGGITAEQIKDHVFAHPLFAESLNNLFMTLK
jgi:pyruvate/2-oxoglutarate dehydrogenase complex dihydrolipoamide dehydrogenase (E3) component